MADGFGTLLFNSGDEEGGRPDYRGKWAVGSAQHQEETDQPDQVLPEAS